MPAPLALLSRLLLDRRVCADCISDLMAIPADDIAQMVTDQVEEAVRVGNAYSSARGSLAASSNCPSARSSSFWHSICDGNTDHRSTGFEEMLSLRKVCSK